MIISKHTHSRYHVWFKRISAIVAFILPLGFLYQDFVKYSFSKPFFFAAIPDVLFGSAFSITILVIVHFYQNVTVTEDGLLVEFLWKDLNVSWDKIIEVRPLWMLSRHGKPPYIVLTRALTPLHRMYSLIYAGYLRPAFIILPTISEYQSLVKTINKHIKKN